MLVGADYVVSNGVAHAGWAVELEGGQITSVGPVATRTPTLTFPGRALLAGMVNAHSHCFHRLLRGVSQRGSGGDFWSWRGLMYQAASRLDAEGLYVVARQAYLEMLLAGITCVGEFHYLRAPAMRDAVARAAQDVGIRLCLLRTVYLHGGIGAIDTELDSTQRAFSDGSVDLAIADIEHWVREAQPAAWGVAAHSLRAMTPLEVAVLKRAFPDRPFHIHVSEQRLEVEQCRARYGAGPIALLARQGVLDPSTTLVHATHAEAEEVRLIAASGASVCICPTTEADLADGVGPVAELAELGVPLCLGSDGQLVISLLEEARWLELGQRLRVGRRHVATGSLWNAATRAGALALRLPVGDIAPGLHADLIAVDVQHPSLRGICADDLLTALTLSADTSVVTDVSVGGEWVVRDRRHHAQAEVTAAYSALAQRFWQEREK